MANDLLFKGFVELRDGSGIKTVEIRKQNEDYNIWVDENLADDVETQEDFESNYGKYLYESLKDYRDENDRYVEVHDIYDFWPEVE